MQVRLLAISPLSCALCDGSQGRVVCRDAVPGLANTFELVRCRRCGLIRIDPAPTEDALREYYQAYAHHMTRGGRGVMPDAEAFARAASDIRDLERWHAPGRLLDIGCGGGHLLRAAAGRGWQVFGTEAGEEAVAALREQFGADHIWTAGELARDLGGARFDAVAMRHVLEHIRAPAPTLRSIRDLLAPRGVLLCEVPDVGALRIRLRRRPLMGQLHLWHFTARTLAALLDRVGFEVREVCFRDHRAVAAPWPRRARRLRLWLENAAWRWVRVELGTNLRAYAMPKA
jgi:2-polyprenyl-3-methyl-5-hydroxy-6-metoxy-1,4-benzoquinol methylase